LFKSTHHVHFLIVVVFVYLKKAYNVVHTYNNFVLLETIKNSLPTQEIFKRVYNF